MDDRLIEHAFKADRVAVEVRSFTMLQDSIVATHFEDSCFIALTLLSRPSTSSGRYEELWTPARYEAIGDVLFVPNNVTMVGKANAGPRRYFACNLAADLFGTDWEELSERAWVESLALKSPYVKKGLQRLLAETMRPDLRTPTVVDAIGTLLALDIQRHLQGLQTVASIKSGGLSPSRMRRLQDRLNSELPIPTLSELAECCGISRRHLARAFFQETGRTIGEQIALTSQERACTLLTTTELPIRTIATQVGFSSPASFAYAFRRTTGMRPSDLRKNIRPGRRPGRLLSHSLRENVDS